MWADCVSYDINLDHVSVGLVLLFYCGGRDIADLPCPLFRSRSLGGIAEFEFELDFATAVGMLLR